MCTNLQNAELLSRQPSQVSFSAKIRKEIKRQFFKEILSIFPIFDVKLEFPSILDLTRRQKVTNQNLGFVKASNVVILSVSEFQMDKRK